MAITIGDYIVVKSANFALVKRVLNSRTGAYGTGKV
jgi:hypothetical protein